MSEAERVWQLVRGDELLAELVVTGGDFPWLNAEVLPAAAFAEAGPLFDDELRRLELLDEEPEQWEADDLHELLTKRTGRPGKSLILTSNRSSADSYLLFPSAVGGESILDRVLNTRHHLLLEGKLRPGAAPASTSPAPPTRARQDPKVARLRRRSLKGGPAERKPGPNADHQGRLVVVKVDEGSVRGAAVGA